MNQDSTDTATGTPNVYAPPAADVDEPAVKTQDNEFYVVGKTKFFLLFFLTLGFYPLYWFYAHWKRYKLTHKSSLWPVPRAIFAIFFTHSLAGEIDARLKKSGNRLSWSPGPLATAFVLMTIASRVCDRLSLNGIGTPLTDYISLLLLPFIGIVLWNIQHAANLACAQPAGESNQRITGANIAWFVLGGLVWLLVIAGLVLPEDV